MKLNDLRPGNKLLISDTNEVCTIISFSGKYILYNSGTRSGKVLFKCFKPTPLTQEWLVNFGFINDNGTEYPNYKLSFYTCMWRNGKTNFCNNHGFIKDLKYVHELQNLYYVLTEKELL